MAFRASHSVGSFNAMSSVSDVPVKISDKFIAPKKVTLPLKLETSFQNHNPSEVLFMEYNFELEENIIKWSDAYRESKKVQNQAETKMVGDTIEQFSRLSPGVAMLQSDQSDDEARQKEEPKPEDVSATSQSEETHPAPSRNPFAQSLGTDILVPMQAMPNSKVSDTKTRKVSGNNLLDLADFEREREQDPFDNAELRVLNDMQELKKVLQSQTAQQNVPESSLQNPEGDVSVTTNAQTDIKQIEYPELDSLSSVSSNASSAIPPNQQQTVIQQVNYSQSNVPYSVGLPTSSLHSGQYPPQQINSAAGNPFKTQTVTTQNPFASNANRSTYENYGNQSTNPFRPTYENHFPNSSAVTYNKQQDSAYLQFPSANQGNQQGASFGFLSHGGNQFTNSQQSSVPYSNPGAAAAMNHAPSGGASTLQRLRSCRSTPDITALSDNAPMHHLPTSHTPPPNVHSQRAYLDAEKRKSAGFELQPPTTNHSISKPNSNPWGNYPKSKPTPADNNPWGSYPTSQAGNAATAAAAPTATSSTVAAAAAATPPLYNGHNQPNKVNLAQKNTPEGSLPNPYDSLSSELKTLTDNISAMGFPRARVARAVKKLGVDDKQVIDHLCLIDRLSESKEYSGETVEGALQHYKKEDSIKQYLKLLTQFRELGFTQDKIKEALVTSKLDENKALDILTGNA